MVSLKNEKEGIREDSKDDFMVNLNTPAAESPTPTKLYINFGNTNYWVMVDSGSSNRLVTKRMAHEIKERDKNSWWRRIPQTYAALRIHQSEILAHYTVT